MQGNVRSTGKVVRLKENVLKLFLGSGVYEVIRYKSLADIKNIHKSFREFTQRLNTTMRKLLTLSAFLCKRRLEDTVKVCKKVDA